MTRQLSKVRKAGNGGSTVSLLSGLWRASGGQLERIALARALYRRAFVPALDEATGQLDRDTEHSVIETLQRFDRSVTIIVVAHRASAPRDCDFLVELKDSRIEATENVAAFERNPA